jgi:2-isopropylmalate synthase
VARVELEHGHRGRVCDLASAPGALDAAFKAVSQIIGLPARVEELDMQYVAADPEAEHDEQAANVLVEIQISVDGELFSGRARARDVLPCCVAAYIDAASNAEAVRKVRIENNVPAPAKAA